MNDSKSGNEWGPAVSSQRATTWTVYPDRYDEYTFSDKYVYTLTVEERGEPGDDRWCVKGLFQVLNRDGEWEREPSPSNREDDFLARCRFTEEEALRLAKVAVNTLVLNGSTIAQAEANVKARS